MVERLDPGARTKSIFHDCDPEPTDIAVAHDGTLYWTFSSAMRLAGDCLKGLELFQLNFIAIFGARIRVCVRSTAFRLRRLPVSTTRGESLLTKTIWQEGGLVWPAKQKASTALTKVRYQASAGLAIL